MATKTDNKTPLGKFILQKLYLMGKNQVWLAEQMNVSLSHVSVLCSKTKIPRAETLMKISKILNVDISLLYEIIFKNFN